MDNICDEDYLYVINYITKLFWELFLATLILGAVEPVLFSIYPGLCCPCKGHTHVLFLFLFLHVMWDPITTTWHIVGLWVQDTEGSCEYI
jgi:hypothetical protein